MPDELILIVEDFDMLREGMREILLQEGYSVMTAREGVEALEQMGSLLPDLIISDITMPGMDGYEFLRAVRARHEWVSIPFVFLSARSDPTDMVLGRQLGVDDYLTKPIDLADMVAVIRSRLQRFSQNQMARIQQAYLDSVIALANAIEQRIPSGDSHIQRVSLLALALARRLGWDEPRLNALQFAAVLHDIGKINIPADILFKADPLNAEDWATIRRHPLNGAEMIRDVPYLAACIPFVRHHHERWDGHGYPDGLAGTAIPDGARILAVADSFDAMCLQRPYAQAMTPQAALAEIVRLSGSVYDPLVVQAFQAAFEAGELS